MCENLIEPLDAAIPYGVGSNDDWVPAIAPVSVPVHQVRLF